MNIFDYFDAKPAKAFGATLAASFTQSVPVDGDIPNRKFSRKAEATLKRMDRMVIEFRGANKLNIYKKAQLGNSFKWHLKDIGYEDAYIDRLTEWLLERL